MIQIGEMCVLPLLQRQGIGRALLAHLVRELEMDGTNKLYLIMAPESYAVEFYAKQGFRTSQGRVVLTRTL